MVKELGGKVKGYLCKVSRCSVSLCHPYDIFRTPLAFTFATLSSPNSAEREAGTEAHLVVVLLMVPNNRALSCKAAVLRKKAGPTSLLELKAWTSCSHDHRTSYQSLAPS